MVKKMKERITNLLEGNFNYENGSLDFSCTKLELTLYRNELTEGSFKVYGPKGRLTEGYVYSTEKRMECLTAEFAGEEEEIAYSFDATGLEEGDVLKGEFIFISNQGEYYLPYVVTIAYHTMDSSLGVIKNLFHFTNLAKSNWDEALRLFYSADFSFVFTGSDKQYYQLYKGLSVYRGNEQNMEEFLLIINKKQRIDYLLSDERICINDPVLESEYSFTITRNGWGYTHLTITSESGIIAVQKEVWKDDDFLGNACRVRFYIKEELLHAGNNYDVIRIQSAYASYEVKVKIEVCTHNIFGNKNRAKKQLTVQLMDYYQAFRLKKIGTETWLLETQKLVDGLIAAEEGDPAARLFQAQLLISQERYNEAQWILDHAAQMLPEYIDDEPVLWAYQMYLTTLINRDEDYTNDIALQVDDLYKRHGDWHIAWLLLYLSEEYNKSGAKKWMFLEELYRKGCTSPMIYIEALILLHMNPTLFMKLSDFEIQALHYAAKNDVLSNDMITQLACLVPREKEFSNVLLDILTAAYKKKPDNDTLTAICSLLMKGGKTDGKYFVWYEKAVEAGLRLTRLYDYYMMSLNLSKYVPIHKMVLMYYSYHSDLDYERSAYLYVNIHRRKEELPELYLTYLPQIESFVEEQIIKCHINANLAYLYKNFLQERMINEQTAEALAGLIFMHQIVVENENYVRVIIRHPHRKNEDIYPVSDGRAIIPLFGQECTVLFEDSQNNRFTGHGSYVMEKLMLPGKVMKLIGDYAINDVGLNLYLCENNKEGMHITKETAARFESLYKSDQIEDEYRLEICVGVADYYYEQDCMDKLDGFLSGLKPDDFGSSQRNEIMRLLVVRDMYDKAYHWVEVFGTFGLDAKTALKLASWRIREHGMNEDAVLTRLAGYVFIKGKYDETILEYLISYYNGMTKELRDLWKAAKSFDADTYPLCERIIIQMLFTGSFVGEKIDIFKDYVMGGAKLQVEEAFLSQCAYDYFVKDRIMDAYIFEEMLRILNDNDELHPVCKYAVLKYYAENPDNIKDIQKDILIKYVQEMILRQINLPFLKQYEALVPAAARLSDKTIVEYHATPGNKAKIHYVFEKEAGEPGEYRTEEMTEVYGGVCFKEFQLFFGENIQYYITEESDGSGQLTESAKIQKSDIDKNADNSRYSLVNDIAIAHTLQDYDTIDDLMMEYHRISFLTERLFTIR